MEIMAKKKRYLQKEVKTVEVYRKPTLQEAWDVVSEHLETVYKSRQDLGCVFIDWYNLKNQGWYVPVIHTHDNHIIVKASKKWSINNGL